MPKSAQTRNKKYIPGQFFGNRKIPVKPKWMRVMKAVGFTLLALLMVAAMVGLILKHVRHA